MKNVSAWIVGLLGLACALPAESTEGEAQAPAVVQKVGHAVERGVEAAASGVKRAARATAHGVGVAASATARGVQAAASGVARGASAAARGVETAAGHVQQPAAPASSAQR